MNKKGNMKTISEIQEIINKTYTMVPLLQRNYKWSMECAAELAEDLWTAKKEEKVSYQLNMITIYNKNEKDGKLQILDGQQRMITIKLLLAILSPKEQHLNFDFERDYYIDERAGRRYFVNRILPEISGINRSELFSVDSIRLFDNYNAMRIPLSFKTIYEYYCELLDNSKNDDKRKGADLLEVFKNGFRSKVIESLDTMIKKAADFYDQLNFEDDEIKEVYDLCIEFQGIFVKPELEEDISNDEIRVSAISDKFQRIWVEKVLSGCVSGDSTKYEYKNAEDMVKFILNNVEMLFHETNSEPIDEFLNINENKTRFVISDYIRANMISDNPIDGVDISEEEREKNKRKRKETLSLFAKIAKYLYAEKYNDIWRLVKTRYDDFDSHPDINRMKVVFCDKYIGTSTKNYVFEEELERIRYIAEILEELKHELGIEEEIIEKNWNTYNAVYMLLECKEKYRFFSLFTKEDIKDKINLSDVTARERFCFFEDAYKKSEFSDDPWDLSYFLESQLYKSECNIKKSKILPTKKEIEADSCWVYMNRGAENDELSKCIKKMINKYKER